MLCCVASGVSRQAARGPVRGRVDSADGEVWQDLRVARHRRQGGLQPRLRLRHLLRQTVGQECSQHLQQLQVRATTTSRLM